MMLYELKLLLDYVDSPAAPRKQYIESIVGDNCLKKSSVSNRRISARHLSELYGLDPSIAIFRALRYFWERDEESRPYLALLCSCARDSLLHHTMSKIIELSQGYLVTREVTEQWVEELAPGRFSQVTRSSIAKNINSTWTQAGHLSGKVEKFRTISSPAVGAVVYALFLAYVSGDRGVAMLQSTYVKALDCSTQEVLERAFEASQRGWISLKRIANVIDISFSNLLSTQELELLREQT